MSEPITGQSMECTDWPGLSHMPKAEATSLEALVEEIQEGPVSP